MEFITECFYTVNLPATLALLVMLGYWVMVISGVLGAETLDFDFDVDADIDMDGDVDVGSGFLRAFLELFYIGEVPVVVVASIFTVSFWVATVVTNHYLNPGYDIATALLWAIPNLVISLLLTKVCVMPLARLFRNYDNDESEVDKFIGRVGVVMTSEVTDSFGQLEIKIDGPPLRINVRTRPGERLGQGDAARIVQCNRADNTYLVELTKWENQ
ncbi:MAG: hypothetical protein AAF456_04060 [Planctomycetota bacterium]